MCILVPRRTSRISGEAGRTEKWLVRHVIDNIGCASRARCRRLKAAEERVAEAYEYESSLKPKVCGQIKTKHLVISGCMHDGRCTTPRPQREPLMIPWRNWPLEDSGRPRCASNKEDMKALVWMGEGPVTHS